MSDKLTKYIELVKLDLDINQVNIAEVARSLPARRHFWTARLIEHRRTIMQLEKKKADILKEVANRANSAAPVTLERKALNRLAEQSDDIKSINEQIDDNKLIVEFLEQVQKNFFTTSHDVRNIIEIMKLEQL